MTITNMPIEECAEPELAVRPAKHAGNGGFKPSKLSDSTIMHRLLPPQSHAHIGIFEAIARRAEGDVKLAVLLGL
jgi:hypothetical protein